MVAMISSVGTTVSAVSPRYGSAVCAARAMVAGTSCSPSTPSAGVPGVPYSATYRLPSTPGADAGSGNTSWPPPGSSTPVEALATRGPSRAASPNDDPTATTVSTPVSARTAADVARGSAPGTSTTGRPAARAVAAATAVPSGAACVSTSRAAASAGAGGSTVVVGRPSTPPSAGVVVAVGAVSAAP